VEGVWRVLVAFDQYVQWHPVLSLDAKPEQVMVGADIPGRRPGGDTGQQDVTSRITDGQAPHRLVWEGGSLDAILGRHSCRSVRWPVAPESPLPVDGVGDEVVGDQARKYVALHAACRAVPGPPDEDHRRDLFIKLVAKMNRRAAGGPEASATSSVRRWPAVAQPTTRREACR